MGYGTASAIATGVIGSLLKNNQTLITAEIEPLKTFNFDIIKVNARGEEINRKPGQAESLTVVFSNGVTMDFVKIPAGKFLMGSPSDEEGRYDSESPQHEVTVPSFFMGKYEVTQAQYSAVMGNNPSSFQGDKRPVERVSWHDCVKFCNKLSQLAEKSVRLPSEAEWEYACRAGSTTPFHFGETLTTSLANYHGKYTYGSGAKGEYRGETTEVGSFPPNGFGLYDMHGNVWEWCADTWHENYNNAPTNGSAWVSEAESARLLRGGDWYDFPWNCRSATRGRISPGSRYGSIGFRVVLP